jgi:hypothetical protein
MTTKCYSKTSRNSILAGIIIATLLVFGGCITSPYYAQIFETRSDAIPFQIWTADNKQNITIECAKASAHGNPINGMDSYQIVATLTPSSQGLLDANGEVIYQASSETVLPSECWRHYSYSDGVNWITVVRVLQGTLEDDLMYTFDKNGLQCLGQHSGENASWFGWWGASCAKTYINTGKPIRTIFLKAKI